MMKGHCECGAVGFEIEGPINDFSHCHCSQCRRMHGAAYATFAGVGLAGFRYTEGESLVSRYDSSDTHQRFFCSVCGSNIGVTLDTEPEEMYVSMSAIEGDPPRPEGYHIFVGSKAPWHEIADKLEQHETFPAED